MSIGLISSDERYKMTMKRVRTSFIKTQRRLLRRNERNKSKSK